MMTTNGSETDDPSCTWHPWEYSDRIKVARKVEIKREELSRSNNSNVTKRNKLLSFIKEQGSRQEYKPLLGKLVDCGFAEPLHNSNNAWGYFHGLMLETALAKSSISGTNVSGRFANVSGRFANARPTYVNYTMFVER